jgi:hypothetical protein
MKKKEEYRYQFIDFETVETGKFRKMEDLFSGFTGLGSSSVGLSKVPVTKVVAVVFDKKLGKVKYTEIEGLKK